MECASGMFQVGNCYFLGFGTERDKYQAFIGIKNQQKKETFLEYSCLDIVTNMELE